MDKRSMLLKAAADIFSKKGFHNAKIGEIAEAAGVGKGTVYEYFPSKNQLFQEVIKHSLSTYKDMISDEIGRFDDPVDKLKAVVYMHMRFLEAHKNLAKIVADNPGGISEDTKEQVLRLKHQATAKIRSVISEGIERGCFKNIDPKVAGQMFLGGISAVFAHFIFDMGEFPHEEVPQMVFDICLNGIQN